MSACLAGPFGVLEHTMIFSCTDSTTLPPWGVFEYGDTKWAMRGAILLHDIEHGKVNCGRTTPQLAGDESVS